MKVFVSRITQRGRHKRGNIITRDVKGRFCSSTQRENCNSESARRATERKIKRERESGAHMEHAFGKMSKNANFHARPNGEIDIPLDFVIFRFCARISSRFTLFYSPIPSVPFAPFSESIDRAPSLPRSRPRHRRRSSSSRVRRQRGVFNFNDSGD